MQADLEVEFSPSRSSNRASGIGPAKVIDQFLKIHREETDRVRAVYPSRRDVRYGDSERESMDIYFKNEETGPIFVYIHGGYWMSLDKSVSGICVAPLVERGYRVIVADYNLCPSVTFNEIVIQTRRFFKFVLEYASATKAQSISLCGHSAGAHLVATFLEAEFSSHLNLDLVKDIFLISGIYDLRILWRTEEGNPGNVLSLTAEKATALSPILYEFIKNAPGIKVHVLVAEHDSSTFKGQSDKFAEKLQTQGILSVYTVLPDYDHFTIIEELRDQESNISKLLLNALE